MSFSMYYIKLFLDQLVSLLVVQRFLASFVEKVELLISHMDALICS